MIPARHAVGLAAERAAATHLEAHGLLLLERNVSCRMGEIDLVMTEGDTLVFVEVRYRRSASHGGAEASVDTHKQRRIIAAARWYLAARPRRANAPCRFDLVALDGDPPFNLAWLRDAFRPGY